MHPHDPTTPPSPGSLEPSPRVGPVGLDGPPGPPDGGPARRPRRGSAIAAWSVIGVMVLVIIAAQRLSGAAEASGQAATGDDPVGEVMLRLQGRYAVAAQSLDSGDGGGALLMSQIDDQLPGGTVGIRLRKAILAADLVSVREGLDRLDAIDFAIQRVLDDGSRPEFEVSEDDRRALALVRGLLVEREPADAAAPTVAPDDAAFLRDHLGWFGDLVLAPANWGSAGGAPATDREDVLRPARRVLFGMLGAAGIAVLAAVAGVVLLTVAGVLLFRGTLRSRLGPRRDEHALYGEAFALWLVLFLGLQVGAAVLAALLLPTSGAAVLAAAASAFFLSLVAVAWPTLNGLPWSQVRADLGLHRGRGILIEIGTGFLGYAATLPLLGIGLAMVFVLMFLSAMFSGGGAGVPGDELGPVGGPAHPIVGELGSGNVLALAMLLLTGAVAAPIVEEITFRGLLHRHLRDASRGWGTALSVLMSAVVGGVIFAVIHPQGLVAIPALSALAIGFSLAREWRGSLIAAVTMHAINNGVVLGGLAILVA